GGGAGRPPGDRGGGHRGGGRARLRCGPGRRENGGLLLADGAGHADRHHPDATGALEDGAVRALGATMAVIERIRTIFGDPLLFLLVFGLSVLGVAMVYSAG